MAKKEHHAELASKGPPSSTLLGKINSIFYLHEKAFDIGSRPHEAFVSSTALNRWIIGQLTDGREESSIIEVASSGHNKRRLDFAEACRDRGQIIHLLETNHSDPEDCKERTYSFSPLTVTAMKLDLLERSSFAMMASSEGFKRVDGLFTTYGTDSIWSEDDIVIRKVSGSYFIEKYQISFNGVGDGQDQLLTLIEGSRVELGALNKLPIAVFDQIVITTHYEPYDLDAHLYAGLIKERLDGLDSAAVVVPATLVKCVEEAFKELLLPNGKVVIGDIAKYTSPLEHKPATFERTGYAYFKYDDWWLAERILIEKGYKVKIFPVQEHIKGDSAAEWKIIHNMNSHYLMTVEL